MNEWQDWNVSFIFKNGKEKNLIILRQEDFNKELLLKEIITPSEHDGLNCLQVSNNRVFVFKMEEVISVDISKCPEY
jgi:hypothetical protein